MSTICTIWTICIVCTIRSMWRCYTIYGAPVDSSNEGTKKLASVILTEKMNGKCMAERSSKYRYVISKNENRIWIEKSSMIMVWSSTMSDDLFGRTKNAVQNASLCSWPRYRQNTFFLPIFGFIRKKWFWINILVFGMISDGFSIKSDRDSLVIVTLVSLTCQQLVVYVDVSCTVLPFGRPEYILRSTVPFSIR